MAVVTQTSLVQEMGGIVGSGHAFAPEDQRLFAVDGLNPEVVVQPGSYEEVAAVMRFANERGLAVIPRGSGFHMSTGNVCRRYDIALSLLRLNQIIEHEPADLTVTCQAGLTIEGINRHLRESGQMTPFGPWAEDSTTLGGLVAANQSFLRLAYGGPRDFTIGMRVVTADGCITRAGGKVVKNVAGYDLCKLYVASRGTLGVIVEVSFKLVPLPQVQEWIDLKFASVAEACDFARMMHERGLSIWKVELSRSMSLTEQGVEPVEPLELMFSLAGTTAGVERSRKEIHQLARKRDVPLSDRGQPPEGHTSIPFWPSRDDPLICQASVLPSIVPTLIEDLDRDVPGALLEVSPIEGAVSAVWLGAANDEALVDRLRGAVAAMNGTLVINQCSPELKRKIDVFGHPPPSFELMRRIKEEFDPNGVLSPGRFVGRL